MTKTGLYDSCRDAAKELRRRAGMRDRMGNLNSIVTRITGVPSVDWRGQLCALADMVDRPTCEDEGDLAAEFQCSSCGWWGALEERGRVSGAMRRYTPRFCPRCGSEVVGEVDG